VPTVLLAVTDHDQRRFLADQLRADDSDVVEAGFYEEALSAARTCTVESLLIDLALPERRAARLIREVRAGALHHLPSTIAILGLLPQHAGELELARGFEAGADDLARQPVGYVELRCRMEAVHRRCAHGPGQVRRRRVDGLDIDLVARSASFDECSIALSRLEFDLLATLATDPRRVFLKQDLLETVWGIPRGISTRTLDSHACRLRHKLSGAGGTFISNRWGVGYSLVPAQG